MVQLPLALAVAQIGVSSRWQVGPIGRISPIPWHSDGGATIIVKRVTHPAKRLKPYPPLPSSAWRQTGRTSKPTDGSKEKKAEILCLSRQCIERFKILSGITANLHISLKCTIEKGSLCKGYYTPV
jgi:hypothetical protein